MRRIEQEIIEKYPPLLTYIELAKLLGKSTESVRVRVGSQKTEFDKSLAAARIWFGRRVFFRTNVVAKAIDDEFSRDARNASAVERLNIGHILFERLSNK